MSKFVIGPRSIPPFAALRAFQAVGALGGIRKAADAIQTDHTVVSRHVKALETWLGVPLISRVGRGISLTEHGAQFHARLSAAFIEMADATAQIARHTRGDSLRIRAVPGFGYQWLSAFLGEFRLLAPKVQVDLRMTDEPVDFIADGVDIDIRFFLDTKPVTRSGVRSVVFAQPMSVVVASPELIARLPPIKEPRDLLKLPLLHEEDDHQWQHWFKLMDVDVNEPLNGPTLWHAHVVLEAARSGQGITLANRMLLRDDLATGRLVIVGPPEAGGWPATFGSYQLLARSDRWEDRNVARFRRWILAKASEYLGDEQSLN